MSPETPLEITGQLDAGSHEGRLQEVALEFMEYMCYAYKGGYNGLVCYEVEQEAPERGSFVFCFECNKQGVTAIVGEPREEPAVRITMTHSVFHRVFFASPSKWELANLMMRGFIRVSNNYIREVASFASSFDYSLWPKYYNLRDMNMLPPANIVANRGDGGARLAKSSVYHIPMLMRGRSFEVQAASASATLQMISQGAQLQFLVGVHNMLAARVHAALPSLLPLILASPATAPGRQVVHQLSAHPAGLFFCHQLVRQQLSAFAAARHAHAHHMRLLTSRPSIHRRRRRHYTGATPPSTGGIEETSLVSALPSCTVAARISPMLHARTLAIGAHAGAAGSALAAAPMRRGHTDMYVQAGIHANGQPLVSAQFTVPAYGERKEQAAPSGSYIGNTLRWLVWGDWGVSSWLWRSA